MSYYVFKRYESKHHWVKGPYDTYDQAIADCENGEDKILKDTFPENHFGLPANYPFETDQYPEED